MSRLRIVVIGTLASDPYAGMAWMHMQMVEGLRRLGHDAYYFETTSRWPYDPVRQAFVGDAEYSLPYLQRVAESFGLGDRWAYRRSFGNKAWFGLSQSVAEKLLAEADAVINVTGSTPFAEEGLKVGRLIYLGTDPVVHEVGFANNDPGVTRLIAEHQGFATYGENIGTPASPLPPLPGLTARTRQPVLLDLWESAAPSKPEFTTVCNWSQKGEVVFSGETYYWSKDREFAKFIDLPLRIAEPIELAMGLSNLPPEVLVLLASNQWRVTDAHALTTDPWIYRDYVRSSRGEFTVAKDQNVRLRTGWFSERSACYLAASRPVVTQDTGFGTVIPTGEGLFAFQTMEDILIAFDAIQSDYARQARAARDIAREYFDAGRVLSKLLSDLGVT